MVTHSVTNGVLAANVKWDNEDVSINGETLGTNEDVFTKIRVTETENDSYGRSIDDNW